MPLKKILVPVLLGANIATIIAMMLVGYADRLSPIHFPRLTNIGLGFPVILSVNLGFLFLWTIFHTKKCWISFLGFLLVYPPLKTYLPLNLLSDVPPDAIKVLSYNVWSYAGWNDHGRPNPILRYLAEQRADILCLQEAATNEVGAEKIDSVMNKIYPYSESSNIPDGSDRMVVYSRFPILQKKTIEYASAGNHSAAFYLKIGHDTVIVINNHLETTGLSQKDKDSFKSLVKGNVPGDSVEIVSEKLINKLAKASKIRALQAEAVARFIEQHRDKSMIVCGDFNDGPNSYTRHTIAKGLRDCYIETGNGPGISYHLGGFYVRIDHILCSDDWIPYGCRVDRSISTSDHYPIYCWMKRQPKP